MIYKAFLMQKIKTAYRFVINMVSEEGLDRQTLVNVTFDPTN